MSKSVKVLGLDLSTKSGYAVAERSGAANHVLAFGMITAPKLSGWPRVNSIAGSVMSLVETTKPDLVVIEGYGFAQMASVVTLAEIGSVIRFLLWQDDIPFMDVPPSSLKKFMTGHGNARKEMMILNAYQKFGVQVNTNDEADAIGLAMFGLCAAGAPFTNAQRDAVRSVLKLHLPLGKYLNDLTARCN